MSDDGAVDLTGHKALVTGAASGIGAAVARGSSSRTRWRGP